MAGMGRIQQKKKKTCAQKSWNTRVLFGFFDILLVCINQSSTTWFQMDGKIRHIEYSFLGWT